jgi:hypothetical protein
MKTINLWKKRALQAAVALLAGTTLVSAWASKPGRMTGGGSIICPDIGRVTHGFELNCATEDPGFSNAPGPNNLEINSGDGNNFHLTDLYYSYCSDDESIKQTPPGAWFDTLNGHAFGLYNGNPAEIFFVLDDAGEPGSADFASFLINSGGRTVLECRELLDRGNHQAHDAKARK